MKQSLKLNFLLKKLVKQLFLKPINRYKPISWLRSANKSDLLQHKAQNNNGD